MSRSYAVQWYICDPATPQDLFVPVTHGRPMCHEKSLHGLVCTRRIGHSGRHAAAGSPRVDAGCPVFEVWL